VRLTSRLSLLALVALLPTIAIQAYNAHELRRDREDEVRQLALEQAHLASSELERILEGVRSLLIAVSSADSIRSFDADRCVPYLAALLPRVPHLGSISALDAQGFLRCRQTLPAILPNLAERSYFSEIMAGAEIVVGDYTIGAVSEQRVLPIAVPLRREGATIGLVVAALDLNWLAESLLDRGIAPGDSLTVADRNGTILARQPLPEQFIGTRIPENFLSLVTAPQPGALELTSQDGTRRILGYVPIGAKPVGLYVSAGLSADQAFAGVRAATWRSAAMLLAGIVAAVAAALLAGRLVIHRPVEKLLATARAWQRGDLAARTGLSRRAGEFGQIGEEMDRVAGEAERRERAIAESEERYRAIVRASAAVEWRADADGSMQEAPLWAEYTGQPEEEHRGWGWLEMVDPQDRAAARRVWEEAHGQGSVVDAEYRVLHAASGRYRWVHESGVPLKNPDGSIREWVGAVTDIHERRQAEERQRLLLNELNHRVKNTLAVVIAIVRQTLRSSPGPDEAFARIQSRLQALSNTHDLLDAASWEGATIRDVLSAELRPYQGQGDGRLLMDGGPVVLDAKRALALGMIVHELATNAAKYGSLSTAEGRVEVRWWISGEDDGAQLDLTWQERDGPPVAAARQGSSSSCLSDRSVAGDLAGEMASEFNESGFSWRVSFPLRSAADANAAAE